MSEEETRQTPKMDVEAQTQLLMATDVEPQGVSPPKDQSMTFATFAFAICSEHKASGVTAQIDSDKAGPEQIKIIIGEWFIRVFNCNFCHMLPDAQARQLLLDQMMDEGRLSMKDIDGIKRWAHKQLRKGRKHQV